MFDCWGLDLCPWKNRSASKWFCQSDVAFQAPSDGKSNVEIPTQALMTVILGRARVTFLPKLACVHSVETSPSGTRFEGG